MSLNIARQLLFRSGTRYGVHRYGVHHSIHRPSRWFGNTAQRKAIDELGAASEKPQGIKVLTELERLSVVGTGLQQIGGSFKRIEEWIKLIITFGVGTVTLGLGTLVLKVMYYDVEANKEMRLYIEKVVNAAGEKTKLEMELFTERQIQNGIKEIRQVVKEEVQNEMRIKDGGKEK